MAKQTLPTGFGYEFSGLTRSEQESSSSTMIIFALCLTFVYLILSAQYESYLVPLSVILSIPFGIAGAFVFTDLFGKNNDIYMQIALIMLIGLLAKNAILIVQFALERRRTGMALSWASVLGASARLRPILMTSLAMIIGLAPLLIPIGVGYNGNMTLGAAAIGGMLIGMVCQLLVVPALFYIFQYLQEKIRPLEFEDEVTSVDTELLQYTRPVEMLKMMIKMKKNNILIMISAAALLSSCGIYNKYERPEVNTTGLVRDVASATDTLAVTDTTSFGNLPWRSVFTDPQLQSIIEKGLANNTDMLNAALNVKMVEAQLTAAKLAFVPSFTFSPQGTISSWDGSKATKTYSLPINASWSIDLFGNLLNQKRSAQMALLATKDYQLVVKTNLIANIANMYYTLMMLDKQLEIVDNMTGLTKDTWDMMKLQKELGNTKETSVQSAEANYYSVLAQAADLKRQIRETENSLSLLIGQQAQTIGRGKLDNQSLPSEFSTGIGIQMLNNRPDVHYAEMTLAQCFYDVQTARSKFYPNITISASGAFTNSSGAGIVNPGKWLLSAVGSLVQPIFMNGQLVAGLKVAKAQQEQAYNTWQNAVLSAGSEVSNALVLYNSSDEKSKLEQKQIESLTKNVEYTKDLFAMGNSTYLEVISAQQSLLNAELAKVQDDFYKMQAVVNLYYALGGGRD